MNELAQLFLHLLEPLRAQLDHQGIQCVEEEAASIRQVFDLARALRVGQDFGFYQGLLTGINGSPFNRRRLVEGAAEKQALASFCVQEFFQDALRRYPGSSERGAATGANRERWFFESGTTIAFVIGRLALAIHAARQAAGHSPAEAPLLPVTVVTNSFIGITALAGLVEEVVPVHGRLELKYYGFLPFEDADPSTLDPHVQAPRLEREVNGFRDVEAVVDGCTKVFATCSRFSFLFGPLVGSRANCLTKTAMYAGTHTAGNGRRFYLCFHLDKVVPVLRPVPATNPSREAPVYAGLYRPDSQCQSVFPLPSSSPVRSLFRQDSVADLTNGQFAYDMEWHGKMLGEQSPGKVAVSDFRAACQRNDVADVEFNQTWLDWVCANPGLRILVAVSRSHPNGDALLAREVSATNQILKSLKRSTRLKIQRRPDAHVAVIGPVEVTKAESS